MKAAALLVAPAGPLRVEALDAGVAAAEALGVRLAWPPGWREGLLARDGWVAGDDAARAARLLEALGARAAALWMARGGFGSVRTLAALAAAGADPFAGPPVPLWGFSDGTALLGAWDRAGWPAWHAPPLVQLPRLDAPSLERVAAAWHRGEVAPFEGLATLAPGEAAAPLAGGNLCVLASLAGTPWMPPLRGRIAVLEDVGEPPYKVDRLLTQLRLAGALDGIAGLVLGEFTGVADEERAALDAFLAREGRSLGERLGVPVAAGLPVGHDARNAPLPFGRGAPLRARLVAPAGGPATLAFEPAAAPAEAA